MLHEFITLNREEIITRCRAKVATRMIPPPSDAEINHGVPLFLNQLVDALRPGGTSSFAIDQSASAHGHDLLLKGFTVSQVVHDYGDVCQSITELALERNAPINTDDFRMLNGCLDQAIAGAVTMYAQEREKTHLDKEIERGNERMGFLVHELRNLVNTAIVAFEVLKSGSVGTSGSTGAVLNRSLTGLRDLIGQSLDDVRATKVATKVNREPIELAGFIEEVGAAAALAANARDITLVVVPVQEELIIDADPQILRALVGNLLQNAVKFTRPRSTVTLNVAVSGDRALIEVHDQCDGLPGANGTKVTFPAFVQQGHDRSGLGIGLAFSQWGAEANGGRLYARNGPETGCIFTVEMPLSRVGPSATL